MSYLLDTIVIAELIRPKPQAIVLKWFDKVPNEDLHISMLTVGEMRKGVETLKKTDRKEELIRWLEHDMLDWFAQRILDIDIHVTERWGRLQASVKRQLSAIDSLIAATALQYDLRLVTRNVNHFDVPMLQVINPWAEI